MRKLIRQELFVQNKIYNAAKYLIIFFLFSMVSVVLINTPEGIKNFGLITSVICILVSKIAFSVFLFKPDFDDGTLELLISVFSIEKIILAKFCAILVNNIGALFFIIPMIYFFFNFTLWETTHFVIGMSLLLILSSALEIFSSTIQCYFKSNAVLLGTFIMPLLIPAVIIMGLILQNYAIELVLIMIGINLFLLPLLFFFSTFLIKNLYTILSL